MNTENHCGANSRANTRATSYFCLKLHDIRGATTNCPVGPDRGSSWSTSRVPYLEVPDATDVPDATLLQASLEPLVTALGFSSCVETLSPELTSVVVPPEPLTAVPAEGLTTVPESDVEPSVLGTGVLDPTVVTLPFDTDTLPLVTGDSVDPLTEGSNVGNVPDITVTVPDEFTGTGVSEESLVEGVATENEQTITPSPDGDGATTLTPSVDGDESDAPAAPVMAAPPTTAQAASASDPATRAMLMFFISLSLVCTHLR